MCRYKSEYRHYSYGYDTYGRMNQITTPSGSFSYSRLTNSDLVAQMTRPNGVTTTWSYETNRDLVTQVQNGTISTYGYVNDAIGRRTSMSRSGSAYATSDTITYTYNDRSELTGASSNLDFTYSYSYAYDPIGNRVTASEAGVPWTYTTNSLNQYTSATENNVQLTFAYDLDGSMTYRPVDVTSGWFQVWNGENRMVETHKGNDRLTYKYDYMGRRVEKCVYSGHTLTSKTLYVYDGFKCVEELDGLNNNTVLMRHTWQPFDVGLDVILATTDGNGTSYFLHDVNKNVMQKIDSSGALQESYVYAPFGGNIDSTTAHFGFSSEYFEPLIKIISYNYRHKMITHGDKWFSRDPLFENISHNLYIFNNNNIKYFDYLGLRCCTPEELKRCKRALEKAKVNEKQLKEQIKLYDPKTDAIPHYSKHKRGMTKPGGHYKEMKDIAEALARNIEKASKCLDCDDFDNPLPPDLNTTLEDFRKIPEPDVYPGKNMPPHAIYPENIWVIPITTIGVIIVIGGIIYITGGAGMILLPATL